VEIKALQLMFPRNFWQNFFSHVPKQIHRLATGRDNVASPHPLTSNGADTKRRRGREVEIAAERVLPVELDETSPPRFWLVRLSAYGPAPAAPYVVEVLGPQRERPIETDYAVLEVS